MRKVIWSLMLVVSLAFSRKESISTDAVLASTPGSIQVNAQQSFDSFLTQFLNTCYWGINTDSLLFVSSPILKPFIHEEVGFGRYHNPGAYCYLAMEPDYGYMFKEGYYGIRNQKQGDLKFFKNKHPRLGFCEESPDADGVYYREIKELPDSWNPIKDAIQTVELTQPWTDATKYEVIILTEHWYTQSFYFALLEDQWFLVLLNACDCGA